MKKLMGSEKQIKWAEDIRSNFTKCAEDALALQKERAAKGEADHRTIEVRMGAMGLHDDYRRKLQEVQEAVLKPTREERAKMTEEEVAEAMKAVKIKRASITLAWMEEKIKERLEEESAAVWIENRMR